jgi:hypothetical protein
MMKKLSLFIITIVFSVGLYVPISNVSAAPNAYIYADVVAYQGGAISVLVTFGNRSGDTIPKASVQCLYSSRLGSALMGAQVNQSTYLLNGAHSHIIGSYTSVEFGFDSVSRTPSPSAQNLPAGAEGKVSFHIPSPSYPSGTIQCSLFGYSTQLYGVTGTALIPTDINPSSSVGQ